MKKAIPITERIIRLGYHCDPRRCALACGIIEALGESAEPHVLSPYITVTSPRGQRRVLKMRKSLRQWLNRLDGCEVPPPRRKWGWSKRLDSYEVPPRMLVLDWDASEAYFHYESKKG